MPGSAVKCGTMKPLEVSTEMTTDDVLTALEAEIEKNPSSNGFEVEKSKNQPYKVYKRGTKDKKGAGETIAAALKAYLDDIQK